MKYLQSGGKSPNNALNKPPDSSVSAEQSRGKYSDSNHQKNSVKTLKHERPRGKQIYQNETEGSSSGDLLDEDDEEVSNVYRKISERREELNRARRNGDDCHVS